MFSSGRAEVIDWLKMKLALFWFACLAGMFQNLNDEKLCNFKIYFI